jgi:hypothetical protein
VRRPEPTACSTGISSLPQLHPDKKKSEGSGVLATDAARGMRVVRPDNFGGHTVERRDAQVNLHCSPKRKLSSHQRAHTVTRTHTRALPPGMSSGVGDRSGGGLGAILEHLRGLGREVGFLLQRCTLRHVPLACWGLRRGVYKKNDDRETFGNYEVRATGSPCLSRIAFRSSRANHHTVHGEPTQCIHSY